MITSITVGVKKKKRVIASGTDNESRFRFVSRGGEKGNEQMRKKGERTLDNEIDLRVLIRLGVE